MSNTEDAPSPPPFLVAPESRAGIPSTIVARPEADGMVDLANTKDTPKETAPSKSNANPEVQSRTASSAKAANDAEAERAQVEARARAEAQARSDAAAQAETQARADAIAQANALARAQEEAAERARLAEQIRLETEARARSQAAVQVAPTTQPAMPTAGRQQWKDARQFLTLPSSATSLQLAHGESPTALHELATRLGLSDSDTYLIRMDRNGRPWWVLLHGVFDDANQARAKLNQLPRDAAMNSAWPRRVLPLQNELGAPKL